MKYAVRIKNEIESRGVQQFLFEQGFLWSADNEAKYFKVPFSSSYQTCFTVNDSKIIAYCNEEYYCKNEYEIIDAVQLPSIFKNVKIILNSSHTAEVDKSTKTVKVGCQSFTFDKIKELYEATI